jgi:hypothetical protein
MSHPVKLPVNLADEWALVTPSYAKLIEKNLENPLQTADNNLTGKKKRGRTQLRPQREQHT